MPEVGCGDEDKQETGCRDMGTIHVENKSFAKLLVQVDPCKSRKAVEDAVGRGDGLQGQVDCRHVSDDMWGILRAEVLSGA